MRCSRCGRDNPEDAASCVECQATLVAGPTRDAMDLVPVLVTNDVPALAIARSLLDAEGIACEVEGESARVTLGFDPLPGGTGPMRLMVARKDEEAARGLLAHHEEVADADE